MGTQKPNLTPLLAALPPIVLRRNLEKHWMDLSAGATWQIWIAKGVAPKPSKADAGSHICVKTWLRGWKIGLPMTSRAAICFCPRPPRPHSCRKRRQRQGNPSGRFAGLDPAALLPAFMDCGRRTRMLRRGLRTGITTQAFWRRKTHSA